MNDHSLTELRDGAAAASSIDELDAEERHYLLSSPARRAVLLVLAGRTSSMHLTDLASEVSRIQRDGSVDCDVDADTGDLEIVLHHNHLPRLADAGLIEYDAGANDVRPCHEAISVLG